MKTFCPFCEKETEITTIRQTEEMDIRGEMIPVQREYYHCSDCGEEFEIPSVNYDPFDQAYREYRRRRGWVQPEAIKSFRDGLGLSQQQLSSLLGIGIATLNRYENGALQTEANNNLISLFIGDPEAFLHTLKSRPDSFSESDYDRMLKLLSKHKGENSILIKDVIERFGSYPASIKSGGIPFNFDKFGQAMKFFCYGEGEFKTKLMKLLFYADFKHFKEYQVSITGSRYAHIPFGPVPNNYKTWLVAFSSWLNEVESDKQEIGEYTGEVFIAQESPNYDVFSPSEIEVLGFVKSTFKNSTSKAMEDFSHQEKGYEETEIGELISYVYAEYLQI